MVINEDELKRTMEEVAASMVASGEHERRMDEAIDSILTTGQYTRVDGKVRMRVHLDKSGQILTEVTIVKSGEEVE